MLWNWSYLTQLIQGKVGVIVRLIQLQREFILPVGRYLYDVVREPAWRIGSPLIPVSPYQVDPESNVPGGHGRTVGPLPVIELDSHLVAGSIVLGRLPEAIGIVDRGRTPAPEIVQRWVEQVLEHALVLHGEVLARVDRQNPLGAEVRRFGPSHCARVLAS